MPLGEKLLDFQLKATSIKPIDLGGGQTRVEVTYAGEVTGDVPGQHFGTLTFIASGPVDRPVPWTWIGATLTTSGAIVRVTGQGQGVRTGDGHKARYRGTACYLTEDPKLAKFNNEIVAVEFETDPATQMAKGAACVWK
jgi:hypothetical protein